MYFTALQAIRTCVSLPTSQNRRLQAVSTAGLDAKHTLAERQRVAERVLQLGERARQLMTQNEKVLPLYTSANDDTDPAEAGVGGAKDAGFTTLR